MGNQQTSGNTDEPNYTPGVPLVHPTTESPRTSQSFCVIAPQKMIITNTPHDKLYGFHSTTFMAGDNNLPKKAKRERSEKDGQFVPVWNTTNTNIEDEDKTFDLSSKLSVLVTSATDSSGEVPKVGGAPPEYPLSKEDILKEEPYLKRMDNWKKVKQQLETRSGPGVPNYEKTSPEGSASRLAKCEAVQTSPAENERARKDLVEDESYVKFMEDERRQTPILNDTGGGRGNNKCNDGAPTLINTTSNHYDVSKDVESTKPTATGQVNSPSGGSTESRSPESLRSLGSCPGVYLPNDVNQGVQDQKETNVHYTPNQEHTNMSTLTNTDLENVKSEKVNVDTSVQSFREVVENKKRFVDKTLLIKQFVRKWSRVEAITAPRSFGKSTVVDMIKKFFEVTVDSQGTPIKPIETTDNYNLFCNPELNICKDKKFVEAHLGKYPVIHINYNKLKDVKDFLSLLTGLQQVICDSFQQHKYLKHNKKLFYDTEEKDRFVDYCNRRVLQLSKDDIRDAFQWLSELLFKHFGRPVIILLDECDAYTANMLNRSMSGVDEIVIFLRRMHSNMFNQNEYLEAALLTGILLLQYNTKIPTLLIRDYRFLGNHDYSSYYGFTRQEVQQLLEKNAQKKTDVKKFQDEIGNYYGGYNVQGRDTKLYSPSSILRFLDCDMTVGNYWIKNNYIRKVFDIIKKNELLVEAVKKLVLEDVPLLGDIDNRLYKEDLMLILDENEEFLGIQMERLAVFLFDIGYLTPEGDETDYPKLTPLKIPNKEIYLAFCKFLKESYIKVYKYSQDWQDALNKAVESFKPDESNMERYKSFYQAAQNYIISSTHYPQSKTDFKLVFFVPSASWDMQVGNTIATEKVTYDLKHEKPTIIKFASLKTQTELFWETNKKTNNDKTVRMDVILVNGEKTLIVFEIKVNKVSNDKETTLDTLNDLAKEGLVQILEVYDSYLNNNEYIAIRNRNVPTRGRIYIGLAYDITTRQMSMSFYQPSVDEVPVFHNSSNVDQDYAHIS